MTPVMEKEVLDALYTLANAFQAAAKHGYLPPLGEDGEPLSTSYQRARFLISVLS